MNALISFIIYSFVYYTYDTKLDSVKYTLLNISPPLLIELNIAIATYLPLFKFFYFCFVDRLLKPF